jgi:hypothetical protein
MVVEVWEEAMPASASELEGTVSGVSVEHVRTQRLLCSHPSYFSANQPTTPDRKSSYCAVE